MLPSPIVRRATGAAAARRRPHVYVSPLIRLKAWWYGLDSAENLARYGDNGLLRSLWMEWRGTLVILGCVFSFVVGRSQSNRANHILENIELNRRTYYQREFTPEYVNNAPGGVYDGPKGYTVVDETSGLKVNADNRIVSNETPEQLRERLAKVDVSEEMIRSAQQLLDRKRY